MAFCLSILRKLFRIDPLVIKIMLDGSDFSPKQEAPDFESLAKKAEERRPHDEILGIPIDLTLTPERRVLVEEQLDPRARFAILALVVSERAAEAANDQELKRDLPPAA